MVIQLHYWLINKLLVNFLSFSKPFLLHSLTYSTAVYVYVKTLSRDLLAYFRVGLLDGQAEAGLLSARPSWAMLSVTAVNTAVPVLVNDVSWVEWGSSLGVDYFSKQGAGLKGWVTALAIGFSSRDPWQQ